ncbi:MAG: class I SAM-dependent methyltransferase [Actinomycetes bacterium]
MSRSPDLEALAQHWSDALASWAIPAEILAQAERDPWALPVERFAERADRAVKEPEGPSFERAAEPLKQRPGSVLDVGAGAGAASLPLARWATRITAVDDQPAMLDAFDERATALGVDHSTVEGRWPEVSAKVSSHDVTVVHHVVYNVPDLVPFLRALDAATVRRVVLELPTHHPLTWMNPLWKRFHGVSRPSTPAAGDLVEILSALEVTDLRAEYWMTEREAGFAAEAQDRMPQAELIAQRLCLPSTRAQEVAVALDDIDRTHRDLVTVSWTPAQ